jgi:FAD dependent oxidoreductase
MKPTIFQFLVIAVLLSTPVVRGADGSPGLHYYYPVPSAKNPQIVEADVCVYGGTPGGVAAAVQAARMGKKTIFIVFGRHVGGMTSGGLSATDTGNEKALGGMAMEFYHRVGKLRGFRPSEAETAFRAMLNDAGVAIYFENRLKDVTKDGNRITTLRTENGDAFKARVFVDASYEGDLFAAAGVSFHVGREDNAKYKETHNGVFFGPFHNFTVKVDPYRVEGKADSGLLWGLSGAAPGKPGQGDAKVQAYNFRMWLTDAADRLPFPKPAGYDREHYALLLRYLQKQPKPVMPFQLNRGDCNNSGGFSTDYIGGADAWPLADYTAREKIYQDHVTYQQGLMWFMANDPEVPEEMRAKVRAFGLPKDEFEATGGWPHELYVREGRRMVGAKVMTEANCAGETTAQNSVGLASYTMDSHNCQRVVIDEGARNEGDVQIRVPRPYPVDYRSLTPKEEECANLLVPVCLSASHIAYGSIRMEPVYMILGQSAGTAAALAIDEKKSVQRVDYAKLRERLLAGKQILTWDAKADDKHLPAAQPPPGVEVRHDKAVIVGDWQESGSIPPFTGDGYLHDGNSDKGKKSVRFTPDLPAEGVYDVYLLWSSNPNRATNTPVEIAHAGGATKISVNQRDKGGWVKVFTGKFKAGRDGRVTIRNDGTDGYVIADSVRWVKAK